MLKVSAGRKDTVTFHLPDGRRITVLVDSLGREKAVLHIDAPPDVRIERPAGTGKN